MTSAPTFFNSADGGDWPIVRRIARRQPGTTQIFADTNQPVEQAHLLGLFRPCPNCGTTIRPFKLSKKSKYRSAGQRIYFTSSCGSAPCRTSRPSKALRSSLLNELAKRDAELVKQAPSLFDLPAVKGKVASVFETPDTKAEVERIAREIGTNAPRIRRLLLEAAVRIPAVIELVRVEALK